MGGGVGTTYVCLLRIFESQYKRSYLKRVEKIQEGTNKSMNTYLVPHFPSQRTLTRQLAINISNEPWPTLKE